MLSRRVTVSLCKCPIICKKMQVFRCMSATNVPLDAVADTIVVGEGIKAAVTTLPQHSVYNVIGHYQTLLDTIQVSAGVPWWVVLIGTGAVLRSSLLILNVGFEKRYVKNAPHLAAISKLQMQCREAKNKGDMIGALTKSEEINYYKKKSGFSWKNSANWFLLPNMAVLTLNFISIRGLADMPYQPLLDTSFLWLPDLCQADPYYMIPAFNAAAVTFVMKYGIDSGDNNIFKELLSSNKVLFGMMAVMGAIQSMFPSALVLYWFASNVVGITVIGPMLRNNGFRKAVGLVTMEEKREALKVMPTIKSVTNDVTQGYNEAREASYVEDMERRKQKLATLDGNEPNLKEMNDTLEELKLELEEKEQELIKLRNQTSEELKGLKNIEEFKNVKTKQYREYTAVDTEQIRVQEK